MIIQNQEQLRIYVNKSHIDHNRQNSQDMMPPLTLCFPEGDKVNFWDFLFPESGIRLVYDPRRKEGASTCLIIPPNRVIEAFRVPPSKDKLEILSRLQNDFLHPCLEAS